MKIIGGILTLVDRLIVSRSRLWRDCWFRVDLGHRHILHFSTRYISLARTYSDMLWNQGNNQLSVVFLFAQATMVICLRFLPLNYKSLIKATKSPSHDKRHPLLAPKAKYSFDMSLQSENRKHGAGVTRLRFKCESILNVFTLFIYFTTHCAKKKNKK